MSRTLYILKWKVVRLSWVSFAKSLILEILAPIQQTNKTTPRHKKNLLLHLPFTNGWNQLRSTAPSSSLIIPKRSSYYNIWNYTKKKKNRKEVLIYKPKNQTSYSFVRLLWYLIETIQFQVITNKRKIGTDPKI